MKKNILNIGKVGIFESHSKFLNFSVITDRGVGENQLISLHYIRKFPKNKTIFDFCLNMNDNIFKFIEPKSPLLTLD